MKELELLAIRTQRDKLLKWFGWYDSQVAQYNRAVRTNMPWIANDGEVIYTTLADLDAAANNKQSQLAMLKTQLKG